MKKLTTKHIVLGIIIIYMVVMLIAQRDTIMDLRTQLEDVNHKLELSGYETFEVDNCPMCETEVKLRITSGGGSFKIECDKYDEGCGLETGYYKSKKQLVEDWNNIN